jgi:hypothetical protein
MGLGKRHIMTALAGIKKVLESRPELSVQHS